MSNLGQWKRVQSICISLSQREPGCRSFFWTHVFSITKAINRAMWTCILVLLTLNHSAMYYYCSCCSKQNRTPLNFWRYLEGGKWKIFVEHHSWLSEFTILIITDLVPSPTHKTLLLAKVDRTIFHPMLESINSISLGGTQ